MYKSTLPERQSPNILRRRYETIVMSSSIKGRGAAVQPTNPYLAVHLQTDLEHVADDEDYLAQLGRPPTEYLPDESQSIVAENDSPDVGFRYSVNLARLQLLLRATDTRVLWSQRRR
jgi:hypothetical protein